MQERLSWSAWAWTLGALAVFIVASFIPAPGIDQEALREVAARGGLLGLFNLAVPQIPIVQGSLGLLVVIRGLLRLAAREDAPPRPWLTRAAVFVYVLLAFGAGLVTAMWLESAGLPWNPPVQYPGWGTRLLIAVTLAGGAMLVWILAPKGRGVGVRGWRAAGGSGPRIGEHARNELRRGVVVHPASRGSPPRSAAASSRSTVALRGL